MIHPSMATLLSGVLRLGQPTRRSYRTPLTQKQIARMERQTAEAARVRDLQRSFEAHNTMIYAARKHDLEQRKLRRAGLSK